MLTYDDFKDTVLSERNLDPDADRFFKLLEKTGAVYSPSAGLAILLYTWPNGVTSVEQVYITQNDMAEWIANEEWLDTSSETSTKTWALGLTAAFDTMTSNLSETTSEDEAQWCALIASIRNVCLLPDWTDTPR